MLRVVVTGGGTIAPIDDVRHIANGSSGRFSAAISEDACLRRGAAVWHLHTPTAGRERRSSGSLAFDLDAEDSGSEFERLTDGSIFSGPTGTGQSGAEPPHLVPIGEGTVSEYESRLRGILTEQAIDVAFLTMAVSDFTPEPFAGKLDSDRGELTVRGKLAPKVIRSVRAWSPDVSLVGFKLLSGAR